MTYSLLIFRCDQDRLERLNQHVSAYEVESVSDADSARAALRNHAPDALIAPISTETLSLFRSVIDNIPTPERPLLVLVADRTPREDFPADLVLPVRWLNQPLHAQLILRGELLQLRKQFADGGKSSDATDDEVDLLKNAIVRAVSHELKTPLLHVKSAVSMLSEDHDRDRTTLLSYATEATARLEAVVRNITQLADSLEITLTPVQAADAIQQAVRNLRRAWEHMDEVDRVQIDLPSRMPLVWADRQGLGIVLQLLIDNALKFSDSTVELTTTVIDDHVMIAVTDHGIGIAREKQERIFDTFYQVDSSDARRFGGVGVGLAIVRLILERHHATVHVESEVGVGSTFSFALRCVE